MKGLFIVGALAVGCSGAGDDDSFTCEQADRSGTYLMHYEERPNGTCGQPPDEVGRLDGTGDIGPNCVLEAADTWSSDGCRLDRSIRCCEGAFCISIVSFTEQRDPDGSRISGVMTMRIEEIGATGVVVDACTSTYDVTATRQ